MKDQELRQLPIETIPDIATVHETAMQLARAAGLAIPEQISFAAELASVSKSKLHQGNTVVFSFERTASEGCWLKAVFKHPPGGVEKEIPDLEVFPDLGTYHESFWRTRNQLEQSVRDMEQFTYAISHDLKNSLTKLKLALSLVEDEQIPAVMQPLIQIIHRSAGRMETTMMGLSRLIELDQTSITTTETISLQAIFEDAVEEFSEMLTKLDATIQTRFEAANLNYIEVYLKSLFSNLISNAIKYRSHERPLHLDISSRAVPEGVELTFSDNGCGLDLDAIGSRLFLPFSRFSNNVEGSGLGLYLVKNMVERNGGRVEVNGKPGQGCSFRFILRPYSIPEA